ncbi:hypothetical protein GCM10009610_57900 [Pseudonocardia xinjiangensis]
MAGMRATAAQALGLLLLGSVLIGTAVVIEQSLLMGVLGALLCAWGLARRPALVLPAAACARLAVAVREHHRALARRAVPRQRDPDAAGHTRSRAPSELLPAV